jgi:hypothetical protein
MTMWLRLGGALLITLLVMAALEYFGVSSIIGGRSAEDAQPDLDGKLGQAFWFAMFGIVMLMSFVAAVRRWIGHLRRALAQPQLRRRDVT